MRPNPNPPQVVVEDYDGMEALGKNLNRHTVWFGVPRAEKLVALGEDLAARLTIHRSGLAACATIADLRDSDLAALSEYFPHCFVNNVSAIDDAFPRGDLALRLVQAGCRVFFRHGSETGIDPRVRSYGLINSIEFLLSDGPRLECYPQISNAAVQMQPVDARGQRKAVAILDLVQDFEILRPLLARAAGPSSPFDLRVAVTGRVLKSQIWPIAKLFLEVNEIGFFTPLGPADVANALGGHKALLLTAAESTAAPHAFAHMCCRIAPPRTLRVTMQHGFENVGLRHHRAHDIDFPHGVRFSSDIVLTWDHVDTLPNLHPAEVHKCIPVGVVKAMGERASTLNEQRWQSGDTSRADGESGKKKLLVAENLHSVRFRAPDRYQRFLSFIEAARGDPSVELTIRSHPATRALEMLKDTNRLAFLDGILRIEDLQRFDSFVSPASTVLLDAVLAGVPSAIWSDSPAFGDATNYDGLPMVSDFSDWIGCNACHSPARHLRSMKWATNNACALNGVPAAWNRLLYLMG